MTRAYVLAVDQGTSSTKGLLLDATGNVVAQATTPLAQTHPGPGLVEQDPLALLDSVRAVVMQCMKDHDPHAVAGLALSTQRESALLWDAATGRPLAPLVSWQDQRGGERAARLERAGLGAKIRHRTGLPLDPMFSALKMAALLDAHDPSRARSRSGALRLGTVDAYLLHALTGETVTEIGNASRTQLLNLAQGDWDDELLEAFDIPAAALGRVVASDGPFGKLRGLAPLIDGTPVLAVLGDSHAALFAHAGWRPGTVKVTYGTGSSAMTLAGAPEPAGAACSTIAWQSTGHTAYAQEANIRSTGRTLTWLGELFGIPAQEIIDLATDADAGDVTLVPAFGGLGAPWWDAHAVPVLSGFDLGTGRPQLARAALDSVALQVGDVLAALPPALQVVADGGLSRSDTLMQLQADVADVRVARASHHDLSAAGAAHLAGLRLGLWTTRILEERADQGLQIFTPDWDPTRRKSIVARWHRCLTSARDLGSLEELSTS
ncbi:FGGY family carbohydrate kinase [Streptomyces phaeochromogenes]|uniref:FGGY family carbohydrate kinase n=1 Tax=Streptomyces phaeochromogenes TaxID=1923 RepID=A0ABZ1HAN2_STRPH|nr:FGGY family carbohydrate kinase [Streptomyces phaeochromogenes]WSD14395.1 FGGY family carbohydrate kinase [Streptomyces phaeochromogenes]